MAPMSRRSSTSADAVAPTPSGAADGSIAGVPYRWVAMGVILVGTFMVVLDTTVVNLALPSMQREFGTIEGVEWVVTAYLASVGVAQTITGWAADRFGRKAMFVAALGVFTVASVLCAIAPNLAFLVAARVVKGIGGGLMMPVAMAMIYELFAPAERGRALGWFGIAIMAAPAIGPVLGGGVVTAFGWRWLFLLNVPIGLVGIPLALRLLRETGVREVRRLDGRGLVLAGSGLALLLVGFSRGGAEGWAQPTVVGLIGVGGALVVAFVRAALATDHPLIEVRIFQRPVFAIGMVLVALMTTAQYTRLVYIPLELGTVREIDEFHIGLVMLPSALGMAITMPIGGRLADRIGARIPVSVGMGVLGLSFLGLAALETTTPLPVIAAILFAGGLGSGLAMMVPNIVAMNAVEARLVSQATALSQVSRQVAAAIGTAVVASIFATTRSATTAVGAGGDVLQPYRTVFLVAAALLGVVVIVAQFAPGREGALALQEERQRELDELEALDDATDPGTGTEGRVAAEV